MSDLATDSTARSSVAYAKSSNDLNERKRDLPTYTSTTFEVLSE
jgi:hypothetical protein